MLNDNDIPILSLSLSLSLASDIRLERPQEAKTVRRSDFETDKYCASIVIEEPLSEELKALVRADLKKAWHFERLDLFRRLTNIRWTGTDHLMILLEDAFGRLEPRRLRYLCNKPTAFYWLQSALGTDAYGERTLMPRMIMAAIFEEWDRCHKTEPNIEYGHFFANPVKISSTGPSTIRGVIDSHLSLCVQASSLLDQAQGGADDIVKSLPSGVQHYSLFPLYHAIIVITDCVEHGTDCCIEPGGVSSLRKLAQCQTVLVARTGAEHGLSAPISLETLKSCSLPLERSDVITPDVDVVRVPLAAAVQFIVSLEEREDLAIPKAKNEPILDPSLDPSTPKGFEEDTQVCCSPETWTDAVMVAAEKHGYDNRWDHAWESIRRVRADLVGEDFCELKPEPFLRRWK